MSAQVANPIRRPNAWERREKMKSERRKSNPVSPAAIGNSAIRRGHGLDRSSSDGKINEQNIRGEDKDLPPAFRSLFVPSTSQEQRLKRAGRRVVSRRSDGTTPISKSRIRERQTRKLDILESFAKQGLDDSNSNDLIIKLSVTKPTSPKTDDSGSDDERSIDPSTIQKVFSKARKMDEDQNNSKNRSFGGSDGGHGSSGNLNKSFSLDLSSHAGYRNTQGDINTSASDDQWARFKLLGRIGLGNIQPSAAAKVMIRHNVKVIVGIIMKIVALRENDDHAASKGMHNRSIEFKTGNLLAEVREAVGVKKTRARYKRDPESIKLSSKVTSELEDYVTVISFMYRDNPFHNFEHASTVLNNVNKVVSLCKAPDDIEYHDIRFITTDPWTHFALVFTALIHDVDHAGVPNAQLINEGSHVASAYKNKSVAEQNSLEISWNLLMEPCYRNLREALFANSDELMHFRSLVVTATLATDIADKELAAMRKDRAAEALAVLDEEGPTSDDIASLKATFVLETLIQVADVSHLMMPFEVYKKWNYKLLRETHQAFLCGRAESDPLDSWYQGEFGFFDFYIIPLAKKLDKCGIDSSFYVENATNNRKRWGEIGEDLVNGFRKTLKSEGRSKIGASFDDSSSSESDFDGDSFGEDVESNSDSNSTSESSDDDKKESKPLRTLFRIPPIPTMRRMREIQRQKTEQYNHRVTKSNQQKACPERALSGGNEHVGPVRRIVYKRKTSSREPSPTKDERKGRSKTAVPDGERRYKQRSKSASSEPNGVEVKSDDEYHNPRSVKCRRKKKARSRSLENSKGQKKSMKGKRPEKTKVEEV